MSDDDATHVSRRDVLKVGLATGGAAMLGPGALQEVLAHCPDNNPAGQCQATTEVYPTSPLIGGRTNRVTKGKNTTFTVKRGIGDFDAFTEEILPPTPLQPETDTSGFTPPYGGNKNDSQQVDTHQVGVDGIRVTFDSNGNKLCDPPLPNYHGSIATTKYYRINLQVGQHHFTNLKAVPINAAGGVVTPPTVTPDSEQKVTLPASTIWGFNGTFPGPMINAEYDHPCLVRFENDLGSADPAPVPDFGAPDRAFLTHLHNGHTAPESDGNPFHKPCAYKPGEWVENLYLNWPAGGDDREKQSFLWFHDHRMDHTGANVYKGLVGLYPIYDPILDPGDENSGLGLPGVRRPDGNTFRVDYDIPLVFFDCRLDDGVTPHQDFHQVGGCGVPRPDLYGRTFFKHFPDNGFVGDVFTVNGKACPVLKVKRRKYRFRFLDASIARQYEFKLMREQKDAAGNVLVGVAAAPGQQGQYNFVESRRGRNALGQQCMRFTQIASDGGLLPVPIVRDSIVIWPAKRREVIIDFTQYQDGALTNIGDVIYLSNIAQMLDGRKLTEPRDRGFDANYCVPVLKFEIEGNPDPNEMGPDTIPALLRPLPDWDLNVPNRVFRFNKGDAGGENIWTINGRPFDHDRNEADVTVGQAELWTFVNEGGGWTHPIHVHQEEHQIVSRDGQPAQGGDVSREDVVSLQGGESVTFYRNFRTFTGKYVVHCHNLSHEDHAMMFGFTIRPNSSGSGPSGCSTPPAP